MKKVLYATTALVMTAGVAAAEVTISGFAEMGIFGGEGIEDQFHTDIDATFTMSGVTDNGLTFGASIDLDESDGGDVTTTHQAGPDGLFNTADDVITSSSGASPAFNKNTQGGETIFISGSFGTITMGDTDGAFDWALTEAGVGGSINDAHTDHTGYNGNSGLDGFYDGQIFRYEYVFGDLAFAASLEIDDNPATNGDEVIGLGVRYGADLGGVNVRFGVGYQTADNNLPGGDYDIYGISADARFAGGFRVIAGYSDLDSYVVNKKARDDHYYVDVSYSLDAWTFAANYGNYGNVVGDDDEGFGLSVTYDLGGGAQLQAGYSQDSDAANKDLDRYDFGLALSF